MIFHPDRGHGVTVGAILAGWPLALGVGVLARAAGADPTFGAFLLYAAGGVLLFLALLFAYWTYACASMAYAVDGGALRIRWGVHQTIVPLADIDLVTTGPTPPGVRGLNWPGHHVGRSILQETAEAAVFATDFAGGEAVYVRADEAIYAVTPTDVARFLAEVDSRRRGAPAFAVPARSDVFDARSFLRDGSVRVATLLAVLFTAISFGLLFARYQDLPSTLRVDYPAGGDVAHIIGRGGLFAMPLTALAVVVVNLVLVALLHRHQRALAEAIVGGSVFITALLAIATALAVI